MQVKILKRWHGTNSAEPGTVVNLEPESLLEYGLSKGYIEKVKGAKAALIVDPIVNVTETLSAPKVSRGRK